MTYSPVSCDTNPHLLRAHYCCDADKPLCKYAVRPRTQVPPPRKCFCPQFLMLHTIEVLANGIQFTASPRVNYEYTEPCSDSQHTRGISPFPSQTLDLARARFRGESSRLVSACGRVRFWPLLWFLEVSRASLRHLKQGTYLSCSATPLGLDGRLDKSGSLKAISTSSSSSSSSTTAPLFLSTRWVGCGPSSSGRWRSSARRSCCR